MVFGLRRPDINLLTATNFALRLASLAGKTLLSLYMAKVFGLADLGVYGLAFGCVMIAVAVFGARLDYIISREISGYDGARASEIFGTVSVFFLSNFALGAIIVGILHLDGFIEFPRYDIILIYALCCLESFANLLYNVIVSIGKSTVANALFFVRAGLWTIPAIALSWFNPDLRNAMFVLTCWSFGAAASIIASVVFLARRSIEIRPSWQVAKTWLRPVLTQVAMVWIGSVAVTFGGYLDRFILARFMSIEQVGVATFYLSFTVAVLTLIQSSTVAVSFPQLIRLYEAGDEDGYFSEFRRLATLAGALSGAILLALGGVIPVFGMVIHKPALVENGVGLALLLLATWLRTHAESAYYLLFVERRHSAVWIGNILYLIASSLFSFWLIPLFGVAGLGAAAVISSGLLFAWRMWFGRRRNHDDASPGVEESTVLP